MAGQALVDRYGVAASVAIHAAHRVGDERNHNAHILTTTRVLSADGLTDKTRVLGAASTGGLELKLGPVANAIERCEQFAAEAEGRDYELLTERGARVHAVRQAMTMFAETRERLEMAHEAYAEARQERHSHVSAGLAALRAVAGRQAKEMDQDEIKKYLARLAGRELGADGTGHHAGADAIRDRLKQVLGRDKPDPSIEQQRRQE